MRYWPSSSGERRVNSREAVWDAHSTASTAPARLKGDRLRGPWGERLCAWVLWWGRGKQGGPANACERGRGGQGPSCRAANSQQTQSGSAPRASSPAGTAHQHCHLTSAAAGRAATPAGWVPTLSPALPAHRVSSRSREASTLARPPHQTSWPGLPAHRGKSREPDPPTHSPSPPPRPPPAHRGMSREASEWTTSGSRE